MAGVPVHVPVHFFSRDYQNGVTVGVCVRHIPVRRIAVSDLVLMNHDWWLLGRSKVPVNRREFLVAAVAHLQMPPFGRPVLEHCRRDDQITDAQRAHDVMLGTVATKRRV